jgi:hypothetical protein
MDQEDFPKFSEELQRHLMESGALSDAPVIKKLSDAVTQKMVDHHILLLLEKEEPLLLEDYRKWRKESSGGTMFHWRVRQQ